ncbi:hypothetical protein M1349_02225 [Patescibacteria group bacterium]|nr:hypothetical protein [Patescibacteria group bacterium]
MKKLLIATGNPGKLGEIRNFLGKFNLQTISLTDLGLSQDVEEDGKTYEENSQKKAIHFAKLSNLPTLADDGGLEIDALNGEPGVNSKYWAKTEDEIIEKLARISRELPEDKRGATFTTVISLALPSGKVWSVYDEIKGIIVENEYMKRVFGYPYRSFFYIPEIKSYYHEDEMTKDQLQMYNHRYKAIQKIKKIIKEEVL